LLLSIHPYALALSPGLERIFILGMPEDSVEKI